MPKLFPKSANRLPLQILTFVGVLGGLAALGVTYYMTPKYTRVGYAPVQPVPFSHQLHAGQLGLDCRYCHSNVEKSGHANVPTSQTCMNCHNQIKPQSPLLAVVRQSYESGEAVPWVKIHSVPDYAYFNHAAHVTRGVSCVSCHDRIDQMETVQHAKPFSMEFCLDCHRAPQEAVRPRELVTNLGWQHPAGASGQLRDGQKLVDDWKIKPPQSCSGCHR
ncbi:MAG: cytochrome c3 family protein [Opitutae bacterium]|nr:cytochrome c3 family protein [Opitutae bacterium]